jgi:SAM-dependent methyltransferase
MIVSAEGPALGPLPGDGPGIAALAELLRRAEYTAPTIQQVLGSEESEFLARSATLPAHVRRLESSPLPAAPLVRLFVLSLRADRAAVDDASAPLGAAGLQRLGLVRVEEDEVVPLVRIVPHDELLIASDPIGGQAGASFVPGVHRPSATLAHLTVRRPVRRALDVGTGNGVQAILAAQHAEHVVATDVNPRALRFAEFNARLNGRDNVECRLGSFLEPVAGERFELVVSNPPYVVSPESELVFRDSGMGRDRVSEELVRGLPSHLEEGAFATVMVSWIQPGADETAAPAAWLDGSGCDAWILHSATDDPLATAAAWNRSADSPEEYAERIDRWVDYYRREGIEALGYGAIVLRKRRGENWIRSAQIPAGRLAPASAHLQRLFDGQDHLAGTRDVLDASYAFAERCTLDQQLGVTPHGWRARAVTLALEDGLGFRAGLDEVTARIVGMIAPDRTVREGADAVAAELGAPRDEVRAAAADLVRKLVELGFLEPR